MTEIELRRKVTDMANYYCRLGVWEWNDILNGLIDTYNEHVPLTRNVKYKPVLGGWCGLFVSDMFILTGLSDLIVTEIGAWEFKDNARKAGQWKERGTYIPQPGDIIVYSYQAQKDEKEYTQYHVGIVTNADNTVVYTTEGNVQSRVLMLAHDPSDPLIMGYWAVDYASAAKESELTLPDPPAKSGIYTLKALVNNGVTELTWQ